MKFITLMLVAPLVFLRALGQELLVPHYHSSSVNTIQVSPDNSWFISGGEDSSIRLWSLPGATYLRTITMPGAKIRCVAIHPFRRWVAVGDAQGEIKLWDIAHGTLIASAPGQGVQCKSMAWSSDGLLAIHASTLRAYSSTLHLVWEASGGTASSSSALDSEIPVESADPLASFRRSQHAFEYFSGAGLVFSPDGNKLFVSGYGNQITVWDAHTGQGLVSLSGHTRPSLCLYIDKHANVLYSGGADGALLSYDLSSFHQLPTSRRAPGPIQALTEDGDRLLGLWNSDPDDPIEKSNLTLRSWNIGPDVTFHDLSWGDNGSRHPTSAAIVANEHLVLVGDATGDIQGWNLQTETLTLERSRNTDVMIPSFTSSGSLLVKVGLGSSFLEAADVTRFRNFFSGEAAIYKDCSFYLNGQEIRCGVDSNPFSDSEGKSVRSYSITSLGQTSEIKADGSVNLIATTEDGTQVAWLQQRSDLRSPNQADPEEVVLWDSGLHRRTRVWDAGPAAVLGMQFTDDGSELVLGTSDGSLLLYDSSDGRKLSTLRSSRTSTGYRFITCFAMSAKQNSYIAGDKNGYLISWRSDQDSDPSETKAHEGQVNSVAFAADGSIFSAGSDFTLRKWIISDANLLLEASTIQTATEPTHISLSAAQPILALGDSAGSVTLMDAVTHNIIASLFTDCSSSTCSWIAAATSGLFESSDGAWNDLAWRFNNDSFDTRPVLVYTQDFFYPGLLSKVLNGSRVDPPRVLKTLDRRQHKVALSMNPAHEGTTATFKIDVEPPDTTAEIRGVRLFRNGQLIYRSTVGVSDPPGSVLHLTGTIKLAPGQNRFDAYAYNKDNVASQAASTTLDMTRTVERGSRLFLVGIGIDKYQDVKLALRYAAADVKLLEQAARAADKQSWKYVEVISTTLTDGEATKSRILAELRRVSEAISPEDDLIIYFAGHGDSTDNHFYFFPSDYTDNMDQAISDTQLESVLAPMQAKNSVLVLDACYSGQAIHSSNDWRRGPINANGLSQLAYEKGMYILSASQDSGTAAESSRYGHGLLTQALVREGLIDFKADNRPKNNSIDWIEWLIYAEGRVPELDSDQPERLSRTLKVTGKPGLSVQRPVVLYREGAGLPTASWEKNEEVNQVTDLTGLPLEVLQRSLTHDILLIFFVPQMADSVQLLKNAQAVGKTLDIDVVGITVASDTALDALRRTDGVSGSIYNDPKAKAFQGLGVCSPICRVPYGIMLSKTNVIVARFSGYRSAALLAKLVTLNGVRVNK